MTCRCVVTSSTEKASTGTPCQETAGLPRYTAPHRSRLGMDGDNHSGDVRKPWGPLRSKGAKITSLTQHRFILRNRTSEDRLLGELRREAEERVGALAGMMISDEQASGCGRPASGSAGRTAVATNSVDEDAARRSVHGRARPTGLVGPSKSCY